MTAYYNEYDRRAAAWLRELIATGLIAPGDVDERSIVDVTASDLRGYTQCHFFAGIGGWSYALRLAGWEDDCPVWTGSCPCQPFSCAGKQLGEADSRHLWPEFYRLIRECKPAIVFGEQVASKAGLQWLDGVCLDLEDAGYACGASDLCAASVGAPHIRQRLFWVAYATTPGRGALHGPDIPDRQAHSDRPGYDSRLAYMCSNGRQQGAEVSQGRESLLAGSCEAGRLEHSNRPGCEQHRQRLATPPEYPAAECAGDACGMANPETSKRGGGDGQNNARRGHAEIGGSGVIGGVGISDRTGRKPGEPATERDGYRDTTVTASRPCGLGNAASSGLPGDDGRACESSPSNPWANYDIIPCADGKSRRIESGTFPLAHGVPGRVGLLRGYGNAIVPQVAQIFIAAAREVIYDRT